jgi:hypothetical protein
MVRSSVVLRGAVWNVGVGLEEVSIDEGEELCRGCTG